MAGILKCDQVQSDSNLSFQVAGANVAYMNSTGLQMTGGTLSLAGTTIIPAVGQYAFPATQNASADANTLDDYEEGTWTPTVARTGSNYTFVNRQGTYTKIGRQITVQCYTNISAITTQGSSYITVTGLPFACMTATGVAFTGPIFYNTITATTAAMSVGVFNNETFVYLKSTTRTEDPISENTTTGYLMFTITYFTQ